MATNGKWKGFKGSLERFKPEPEWQARVDGAKSTYTGLDTAGLARAFAHERAQKQHLEAQVKLHNVELEAISQLLVEELEASAIQKVQLDTGETVYLSDEPYAQVEDRAAVLAWAKKKRLEQLLTVQWQTFNAMVKEMLTAGKPVPPGTKVYMKTSARLRGGSRNAEAE